MNHLLVIDPQNDFCDVPGAALPVPGALADLTRLAGFLRSASTLIDRVTVTLDSHPTVAIERPAFWRTRDGGPVAPFTTITAAAFAAGEFVPVADAVWEDAVPEWVAAGVVPSDGTRAPPLAWWVRDYLETLESRGAAPLCVWPPHCVVGTWGHALEPGFAAGLEDWEKAAGRNAVRVQKGRNPLTEAYSAITAEVQIRSDPTTHRNEALVRALRPGRGEWLLVGGEAASHCVAATVTDLVRDWPAGVCDRVILLEDAMSPVPGFAAAGQEFIARGRAAGVRVLPCRDALNLLRSSAALRPSRTAAASARSGSLA